MGASVKNLSDLLPFAREFVLPGIGALIRMSTPDERWVVWRQTPEGMELVKVNGRMATFGTALAAHCALTTEQ